MKVQLCYQPINVATGNLFDGLRGLSALVVAAAHLSFYLLDTALPWVAGPMLKLADLAVMAFFVISGFMIGSSILRRLVSAPEHGFDIQSFARDRLWRLLPPLGGALVIMAICYVSLLLFNYTGYQEYWSLTQFAAALVFLQQMGNLVPVALINGPLWSLSHEFWFYVFAALSTYSVFNHRAAWVAVAALATLMLFFDVMNLRWVAGFGVWLCGAMLAICWHRDEARWLSRPKTEGLPMDTHIVEKGTKDNCHVSVKTVARIMGLILFLLTLVLVFADEAGGTRRYLFGVMLCALLYLRLNSDRLCATPSQSLIAELKSADDNLRRAILQPLKKLNKLCFQLLIRIAAFSYTLYIVHFPVILVWNEMSAGLQNTLSGASLSFAIGGFLVITIARVLGQWLEGLGAAGARKARNPC